jgi:redox-sensitive bicupin YhaK (pirin superfamily)
MNQPEGPTAPERPLTGDALIDETLAESFPASDPPSWTLGIDAEERANLEPALELVIPARERDLGGFVVRRVLPWRTLRELGPFTFLDHMGPRTLLPGAGIDVRPHPHIGLATLSYLFEGELMHRDSLGSEQIIRPGDVNWMIAGRGVVHSERSTPESRRAGARVHGVQIWAALAPEHEERAPSFEHHPQATIPRVTEPGITLDVIAGSAFGARAPASVLSPTLCVHGRLEARATLRLDAEHEERGVYVLEGSLVCEGSVVTAGQLAVIHRRALPHLTAREATRLLLLGGQKLPGTRSLYWNFVASSEERLERAKRDWREERFPVIPSDPNERIPLPE